MPEYTKQEFVLWGLNKDGFDDLYDDWVKSDYEKYLRPSFDRLKNDKPYSFANMKLMTWKENQDNRDIDFGTGKLVHVNKPQTKIEQRNYEGDLINKFPSQATASKETGVKQSNINKVLKGLRKEAGGYKWNYYE